MLIWRYGAACSSFKTFAAPAAQNAAPGGVKDKGVRRAVDRLYYTLSALWGSMATSTTCGAAESHSESCGDREGSEIVIPVHGKRIIFAGFADTLHPLKFFSPTTNAELHLYILSS